MRRWQVETLLHNAIPTGDFGIAASAFFTSSYAPSTHLDQGDKDLTAALRIYRSPREHSNSHHFAYTTLCRSTTSTVSVQGGVVIKQPTGTLWLFDASKYPHATTVAVDGVQPEDAMTMVMVQKKSMLTWLKQTSEIQELIDFDRIYELYLEKEAEIERQRNRR